MNRIIEWWTHNTVAANLLMAACIIAGTLAFFSLERELNPSVDFTGATVSVVWPGASPREVEEQILLRIEEAIAGVDGVEHIDSKALEGSAKIDIEGDSDIDATKFLNEIKNRVDGISTLPRDTYPPVVSQWRNLDPGVMMALSGDLNKRELNRLGREVRDELSQLDGGSPVIQVWGDEKEEVAIELSEQSMRRYNLTFDQVAQAIRGSSLNLAGGQVRTDNGNLQIAARALADTQGEFERIVVRQNPDGSVIRVGDVANVVDGFEDGNQLRTVDGNLSISLAVMSPEVSNISELSKTVNAYVAEKNQELDGKANLRIWFDGAEPFNSQLSLVSSNALLGLFLVLIVLMLFLRPAVAFWVSIGIAVAFTGAFIFMPISGVSLSFISIFAFLLVIGVVVDDAIIVGESIHNTVEEGEKKGPAASIYGTQLVIKPVFFAVLTTIIAFAPWLFIGGGVSQMTRQISLTITFALVFSLIEAFFILPAHLSHMKPQDKTSRFYRFQKFFSEGIMNVARQYYRPLIVMALQFRYYTVALFVVAFTFSVSLLAQGWIPFKFSPEVQSTFLQVSVSLPDGTAFRRTKEIYDQLADAGEALSEKYPEGKDGTPYIKAVYIGAEENNIESYVTLTDPKYRKESNKELAELLRELIGTVPDAEEINVDYTTTGGPGPEAADFGFGVQADDLDTLRLATIDLENYLRSIPGLYDVQNSLQSATPELQVELLPGAERFGLTLGEVARQIRQAFYGEEVQRLPRNGQDVKVMVRFPKEARESLTTIDDMRIRTADGREVPLTAVATAKFAPSYKEINRRDRQRSANVSAEAKPDVDRGEVLRIYREQFLPEWQLRHPEAQLVQRGESEEENEFFGEIIPLYAMAFFAMYMLLAIAFNSYWQPALIMTAIPFGYMGAAFGHGIFGINFAMFSFFGVAAAAGVVVNDNLVLIDYVNRLRAQGKGAFDALVTAGVGRFRPIILTSITTFIGLLPIMFEQSKSAEFLKPTIISLAFGVFFAMFVTLLFVPAMYAVGADIARFYRWAWTGVRQPEVGYGRPMAENAATGLGATEAAPGAAPAGNPAIKPAE